MFRTLAMRLTAAYVFAAIVLVVIVIAAVTGFALSIFGVGAREASEAVARQVPEQVRLEVGRYGSFGAAAPDIAHHLARPGLRIVVLSQDRGRLRLLARTSLDEEDRERPPQPHDGFAFGHGLGPPGGPPFRQRSYPFGLNVLLHLEPRSVAVPGGLIVIFQDPEPLSRTINAFWLAMLPIGAFVIVAAGVLGRAIAGQALRPLVETTASLRRFGEGDFTPRAVVTADRNEIGELVNAYNAAAAQVSAAFEERRVAEQQMRQFIADAGHELRTPLTVVMGFIDVLRRRAQNEPETSLRIYDTMLVESRRMKMLIDKLIVLARLENPHVRTLETIDLCDLARRAIVGLQPLGSPGRIVLDGEPGATVRGSETELYDALRNLIENALKYAPHSPVEVRVRTGGGHAVVDVADAGPGIASDEQSQVFDRFYRGRDRGDTEGFGLGLAIARRAVERAGGRLSLHSAPGQGSRFTIRIPSATRGEGAAVAV